MSKNKNKIKLTSSQKYYKTLMESSASPAVIIRCNLAQKYYKEGNMKMYRHMLKLK